MKTTFPLLAALTCLIVTTVRADDAAVQQIRTARTALVNAKAWRRTTVTTDLNTNKGTKVVVESVQPDLFHLVLPEFECFSDGKRNLVRQKDGTVSAADAERVQLMEFSQAQYNMRVLVATLKEAHVVEHQTFRDLPATVVAFTMGNEGMAATGKMWISDADHLPLKIESETRGQVKEGPGVTRTINARSASSFEYDPSIKIAMP